MFYSPISSSQIFLGHTSFIFRKKTLWLTALLKKMCDLHDHYWLLWTVVLMRSLVKRWWQRQPGFVCDAGPTLKQHRFNDSCLLGIVVAGRLLVIVVHAQWTQNICITFIPCWTNVFDVGPTWYKCYTNVLCLLCNLTAISGRYRTVRDTALFL